MFSIVILFYLWIFRNCNLQLQAIGKLWKNAEKNFKNWLTNHEKYYILIIVVADSTVICGCSSMVEHQPSKLDTWVRFPSPALMR